MTSRPYLNTQGIVLSRTNYEEAARIVTLITPDHGKLTLMARGVRKTKSKLAGGIELFSVSDISYIAGRGEVGTLTSARVSKHYGNITKDLDRTNTAYVAIRAINKNTQDQPEPAYFNLLHDTLAALDDLQIPPPLCDLWFRAQLLKLAGHSPNLRTDASGAALQPAKKYDFDFDAMAFKPNGRHALSFTSDHIKLLRLLFGAHQPTDLQKVQGTDKLLQDLNPLLQSILLGVNIKI